MRLLGFLICLMGIYLFFPAWEQWASVIFSPHPRGLPNFGAIALPIFKQAGVGAVVFWVGLLMMGASRR